MNRTGPDEQALWEAASAQAGYFALAQALAAGYSAPLVEHHIVAGRFMRVGRGIFRLVRFPASENEDLVVAWLWSQREGVFSHETALALHQLSDALPSKTYMTVPAQWEHRRLRVPAGLVLYYAGVPKEDRSWSGPVPVTTPLRTIRDCATVHASADHVRQAVRQGLARGLFAREDLSRVARASSALEELVKGATTRSARTRSR